MKKAKVIKKIALIGIIVGFIFASFTGLARASGEFTEIPAGLIGLDIAAVAWGDYNNDGFLDLAIAGGDSCFWGIRIYKNNGNGTFTNLTTINNVEGISYARLSWIDYDRDGFLDLTIHGHSQPGDILKIYHNNNGNGTFTDINAGLYGTRMGDHAWGDYDNDGYPDLFSSGTRNNSGFTNLYHNNGNNTFTDTGISFPTGIYSAAWGDYNNDGRLDLLIATSYLNLYRNDGLAKAFKSSTVACPLVCTCFIFIPTFLQ